MHTPTWSEGSDVVRAVAELLRAVQWPLVTLIIASFFRADIQRLLSRVRRGSLFGAEVELEEALDMLAAGAGAAEQQMMALPDAQERGEQPAPGTEGNDDQAMERLESDLAQEREILRTASISPRAALMLLSSEIEATLRRLAAEATVEERMPRDTRFLTVGEITRDLAAAAAISTRTEENIENLWKVRALVVHEGHGDEEDVLRAIDSGLTILRTLQRLDAMAEEESMNDTTAESAR
ncbi:MAG: hypothetical protein U0031_20785 [Thermomicrobiales bacterium]